MTCLIQRSPKLMTRNSKHGAFRLSAEETMTEKSYNTWLVRQVYLVGRFTLCANYSNRITETRLPFLVNAILEDRNEINIQRVCPSGSRRLLRPTPASASFLVFQMKRPTWSNMRTSGVQVYLYFSSFSAHQHLTSSVDQVSTQRSMID